MVVNTWQISTDTVLAALFPETTAGIGSHCGEFL